VTLKFLKFSFRADRPRYDHFNGRDYNYESFFRFSTITFFEFGYYHYYYSIFSLFLLHTTTTLILSMFLYFLLFFDWYIYLLTTRYIFLFLKNFNHYLLSQVLNHCLFSLLSCCLECCVAYLVLIYIYYSFHPKFYIYIAFFSELWCVIIEQFIEKANWERRCLPSEQLFRLLVACSYQKKSISKSQSFDFRKKPVIISIHTVKYFALKACPSLLLQYKIIADFSSSNFLVGFS